MPSKQYPLGSQCAFYKSMPAPRGELSGVHQMASPSGPNFEMFLLSQGAAEGSVASVCAVTCRIAEALCQSAPQHLENLEVSEAVVASCMKQQPGVHLAQAISRLLFSATPASQHRSETEEVPEVPSELSFQGRATSERSSTGHHTALRFAQTAGRNSEFDAYHGALVML